MDAKTYNKFLGEYEVNNKSVLDKSKITRRDTMVHPLAIASNFLVKEKVFPNEDAVRLIQELNPKIDMKAEANAVSGDTRFIFPNYPSPSENVLRQFEVEYLRDASPDLNLNDSFRIASSTFNTIFQRLPVPEDVTDKKYYDSLSFFNNRILPYINNSATKISRLQMRYFYTSLDELNKTFNIRRRPTVIYTRPGANTHATASYIIADFYEIANPVQIKRKSIYMEKRVGNGSNAVNETIPGMVLFDDLTETPFACNLYIYGKDSLGNRKPDPEMGLFDVWVGNKLKFTTRVVGSAPESYGFTKMGNPASTLPIWIGLGQWIIVMKKQGTTEELNKEISIYTETKMEANNPAARKVFYILD